MTLSKNVDAWISLFSPSKSMERQTFQTPAGRDLVEKGVLNLE